VNGGPANGRHGVLGRNETERGDTILAAVMVEKIGTPPADARTWVTQTCHDNGAPLFSGLNQRYDRGGDLSPVVGAKPFDERSEGQRLEYVFVHWEPPLLSLIVYGR
jgi:hypothetical protein